MPKRKEYNEKVLKEFDKLNNGRVRVRVVENEEGRFLDIREYVEVKTEKFTGFTRKGVRLDKENLLKIAGILPEVLPLL